jgi:putative DNA primase/helicase
LSGATIEQGPHVQRKPNGAATADAREIMPAHGTLKVSRISLVIAKPIRPLWPGCLYHGKVTVLAGIPGDGKSLSALDIIARISSGGDWPVGDGKFLAATALLLTAEDDPADTIRPRLDQAGANTDLVELIEGVHHVDEQGVRSLDLVSLVNDLPTIERRIIEINAAILAIDPLTSFADSDTNKTADMRRLLDGLAQMAARTDVAVLVITHLNKRSDARKAMQMIAGSHVIVAAVRVVLVTARDPNDKTRRLVLPIKSNIGPDGAGFAFRVVAKPHPVCGEIPTVEWEPEHVGDMSADDVLIDSTPRAQAAVEKSTEVCDWLRDLLKAAPVEARVMWSKAKEKNYGDRRVRSALKMLKATCEVLGFQGNWHYSLPVFYTKDAHV